MIPKIGTLYTVGFTDEFAEAMYFMFNSHPPKHEFVTVYSIDPEGHKDNPVIYYMSLASGRTDCCRADIFNDTFVEVGNERT